MCLMYANYIVFAYSQIWWALWALDTLRSVRPHKERYPTHFRLPDTSRPPHAQRVCESVPCLRIVPKTAPYIEMARPLVTEDSVSCYSGHLSVAENSMSRSSDKMTHSILPQLKG